jgi:hypothetical protein
MKKGIGSVRFPAVCPPTEFVKNKLNIPQTGCIADLPGVEHPGIAQPGIPLDPLKVQTCRLTSVCGCAQAGV